MARSKCAAGAEEVIYDGVSSTILATAAAKPPKRGRADRKPTGRCRGARAPSTVVKNCDGDGEGSEDGAAAEGS